VTVLFVSCGGNKDNATQENSSPELPEKIQQEPINTVQIKGLAQLGPYITDSKSPFGNWMKKR